MNSQGVLSGVWLLGDWVSRTVLLVLLGMSMASWLVIALRLARLAQVRTWSRNIDAFWGSDGYQSGLEALGPDPGNPFRALAEQGRQAALHPRTELLRLQDRLDMSDWISRSLHNAIDDASAHLQSGMALLASVGSTAPFVGLFGTVWGIYHALLGIGAAGQATLDKVAGPIGEALIMTALGLAVAIPAVLGYNALVRANKSVIVQLNRFAHDLHAYWLTGSRMGGGKHFPAPPA